MSPSGAKVAPTSGTREDVANVGVLHNPFQTPMTYPDEHGGE